MRDGRPEWALATGSAALVASVYFSRVAHPNYLIAAAVCLPLAVLACRRGGRPGARAAAAAGRRGRGGGERRSSAPPGSRPSARASPGRASGPRRGARPARGARAHEGPARPARGRRRPPASGMLYLVLAATGAGRRARLARDRGRLRAAGAGADAAAGGRLGAHGRRARAGSGRGSGDRRRVEARCGRAAPTRLLPRPLRAAARPSRRASGWTRRPSSCRARRCCRRASRCWRRSPRGVGRSRPARSCRVLALLALAAGLAVRLEGAARRSALALGLLSAPLALGTVLGSPLAASLAALVAAWAASSAGRDRTAGVLAGVAVALDHRALARGPVPGARRLAPACRARCRLRGRRLPGAGRARWRSSISRLSRRARRPWPWRGRASASPTCSPTGAPRASRRRSGPLAPLAALALTAWLLDTALVGARAGRPGDPRLRSCWRPRCRRTPWRRRSCCWRWRRSSRRGGASDGERQRTTDEPDDRTRRERRKRRTAGRPGLSFRGASRPPNPLGDMPEAGFEPARISPHAPQTCVSASSTTPARGGPSNSSYLSLGAVNATCQRGRRRGALTSRERWAYARGRWPTSATWSRSRSPRTRPPIASSPPTTSRWREFEGQEVLKVAPEALRLVARQAFRDVAFLYRPGHLAQLAAVLDDPEASENDRSVVLSLLRNAEVAGRLRAADVPGHRHRHDRGEEGRARLHRRRRRRAALARDLRDLRAREPALLAEPAAHDVRGAELRHATCRRRSTSTRPTGWSTTS